MKISFVRWTMSLIAAVLLTACNDNLREIGLSTLPASDAISINNKTFEVGISTSYRDSVYVRTGYPLLGQLTDPNFGEVTAGYLAQFYTSSQIGLNTYNSNDSLIFDILKTSVPSELGYDWPDYHYRSWDSICGNRLDSMTVRVYYQSYYGDSLLPMQISVYGLNPEVDFNELPTKEFYSNNNFSKFYDEKNLLGQKVFTAANREISDSARHVSGYMPYIEVRLSDKLKDHFFKKLVEAAVARDTKNPHHKECEDIFVDEDRLREEMLSGVCIRPTFGDGCIVKVYYTAIYFFFSSFHRYDVDGTLLRNLDDSADSTYVSTHVKYMAVTPDVIQMSGYKFNDTNKDTRIACPDSAYLTSPQGYYATIDLPVGQIMDQMMNDPMRRDSSYFLNSANFYLKCHKPYGTLLSSSPAPVVLMVEESKMNSFFENNELPDSTSCYASFVADSVKTKNYYYSFGNINNTILSLARAHGWKKDKYSSIDKDLKVRMAIIPVDVTTTSGNTGGKMVLSVSNYILPTAVRFKKGDDAQSIQMIYTLEGLNGSQNR